MKVLHAATKTPCGQINEYLFSKKIGTITKKKKKKGEGVGGRGPVDCRGKATVSQVSS